MKKNYITFIVCIMVLSLVIAGCGSKSSSQPNNAGEGGQEATAAPKSNVTITVGSSQNWIKDIDRSLAEKFTEETGIKVDFQVNPDDQYTNVLKTKLSTGEAPDIMYVRSGIILDTYQPEKNFLDLSNEPWVGKLRSWAKDGATYKGKVYGLNTWSVDGWGILYNTGIFEKYNLTPPKNYEEFTKINDTLLANGITPIYDNAKDEWHLPLWLSELGVKANEENPGLTDKLNNNEAKFADVGMLTTALNQMNEMNSKGYFGKNVLSNDWNGGYEAMGSGKYAMILVYTTYQQEVAEKYPDSGAEKWKMFSVPLADNTMFAHSSGGIIRAVNKESKNIDAVKQYFEFLTKEENVTAFYKERGDLGEPSIEGIEVRPATEAFKSVVENAGGKMGPDFESFIKFFDHATIAKGIQDMYLGQSKAEDVLKQFDEFREKSFSIVE